MPNPQDRRNQPRLPADRRGVLIVDDRELACRIADASEGGVKVRLERAVALPRTGTLVDVDQAQAAEATVAWQKGAEAGLKLDPRASVRGLVPSRLLAAREAWVRASRR
ncbi:pilus assembly protein PilZ [Brevundimonas sp. LM2]|uniref:PilZ domain-containing protein n=1 Tax=Brevundimonas sp. LM2 TaxID=1938605 RepID=UPI000983DAF0|nr:PilZ domain-containing protein [Brevundimonas sp. LM2]AQR60518.1 pilus assembly protein PilZ [Brevundimonas sp. LM2]